MVQSPANTPFITEDLKLVEKPFDTINYHLTGNRYVQRVLRGEGQRRVKLLHYFPYVKGLERISELAVPEERG